VLFGYFIVLQVCLSAEHFFFFLLVSLVVVVAAVCMPNGNTGFVAQTTSNLRHHPMG